MNEPKSTNIQSVIRAIEEGTLTEAEINRRLVSAIEHEYSKGKEADISFINACEDLLEELFGDKNAPFVSHTEKYIAAHNANTVVKNNSSRSNHRQVKAVLAMVFVFVFIVVCSAGVNFHWFKTSITPDQQQFAIQGHQIDVEVIQRSIAEHSNETDEYLTTDWQDMVDYLGFEPIAPWDNNTFLPLLLNMAFSSTKIRVSILYTIPNDGSFIFDSEYFVNQEDAYIAYEDSIEKDEVEIPGLNNSHVFKNYDNSTYVWIEGNTVYSLLGDISEETAMDFITAINGGIDHE